MRDVAVREEVKPSLPAKFRDAAEKLKAGFLPTAFRLKTTANHKIVAYKSPIPLDSGLNFIFAKKL
jgi:hypothetical protein